MLVCTMREREEKHLKQRWISCESNSRKLHCSFENSKLSPPLRLFLPTQPLTIHETPNQSSGKHTRNQFLAEEHLSKLDMFDIQPLHTITFS